MKKIKNFILAIILPRKTAKFRNMHFVLALFIYLIAMFIAVGSQYMVSETMVKKEMPRNEYKNTFENYTVVGDYDNPNGNLNFYVENLEITSDSNFRIDPNSDQKNLTTKVLTATLSSASNEKITTYVAFKDDFTVDLLTKENLSKNDEVILANVLQQLVTINTSIQTNKTTTNLSILFGKDVLYYLENNTTTINDNSSVLEILSTYQQIKYEDINIDQSLVYLRRLNNLDICSFTNELIKSLNLTLPTYTKVDDHLNYDYYIDSYFKQRGIYHKILEVERESSPEYLDVTIVIDANFNLRSTDENNYKLEFFDYEGYVKQERRTNTTYVLNVFSADRFFYVYDLGQTLKDGKFVSLDYRSNSIFVTKDAKGSNRVYFLPKDASEIMYNEYGNLDTTKWTKEVGKDEQFNKAEFIGDQELAERIDLNELDNIKPVDRHKERFYDAIYTTHSRSYIYTDFVSDKFSTKVLNGKLNTYLQLVIERMISIDSANYELVYGIMAFGIFILFPLLITLLVWLMSRKLVMKRYRQYYAIGSICYFNTAVIAFIVGFFVPFTSMAFILMFVQAWYFIFVSFRINTDPSYKNDDDSNSNTPMDINQLPEFKKVKERSSAKIG